MFEYRMDFFCLRDPKVSPINLTSRIRETPANDACARRLLVTMKRFLLAKALLHFLRSCSPSSLPSVGTEAKTMPIIIPGLLAEAAAGNACCENGTAGRAEQPRTGEGNGKGADKPFLHSTYDKAETYVPAVACRAGWHESIKSDSRFFRDICRDERTLPRQTNDYEHVMPPRPVPFHLSSVRQSNIPPITATQYLLQASSLLGQVQHHFPLPQRRSTGDKPVASFCPSNTW